MHTLLTIALLYAVSGIALLVGIGLGSAFRRWLQRRQKPSQRRAKRLQSVVGGRHV